MWEGMNHDDTHQPGFIPWE